MTTSKRKTTTAIVAGVAAVALVLGGTFAWTSISQMAKNESSGIVNVGGRLHDDFVKASAQIATYDTAGTSLTYNKDVYVENFTSALTGGQPIYARIRLDEYMEIGPEAGQVDENGQYDSSRNAQSVVASAAIDDVETWTTHVPAGSCEECSGGETCQFHEHWTWAMGGQTTFMPTFNKDKDSLAADVNGTFQGVTVGDKVYFDDYVTYTTDTTGATFTEGTDTLPFDEPIYQKTATAYYDNDTDTEENTTEGQYTTAIETHTAKETSDGTVILMSEWTGETGNFWVYDEDGWAYWANPIMPGEATGLLLDGFTMIKNPGEKCYYAINVVAQFATAGDWEYFDGEEENAVFDGTEKAKALLEAAAANVPGVTVSGDDYIEVNGEYTFTATAYKGVSSSAAAGDFEWTVADADGNPVSAETATVTATENGATLTVSDTVPDGTTLIVAARCTDETYLGATGVKSIVVRYAGALIPSVTVTTETASLASISEIDLTAAVEHNFAAYDGADITWAIADADGNAIAETVAYVNENDQLVICQDEGEITLYVTASVTIDGETGTDTLELTVNTSKYCDTCGALYGDNGFCANTCTSGQYEPVVLSADGDYEISNGGQLFYVAQKFNADTTGEYNITLTDNIDLESRDWTPIGNSSNTYGAIFDGAGYEISGLTVNATAGGSGLFGYVKNATIKNFAVTGEINITVSSAAAGFGVVGVSDGITTIESVHSGLVITDTTADASVSITSIGGILGKDNDKSGTITIRQCSYSGKISHDGNGECIGGMAGYVGASSKVTLVSNLFHSSGEIAVNTKASSLKHVGGILGYKNVNNGSLTVSNNLSCGAIITNAESTSSFQNIGILIGCLNETYDKYASNWSLAYNLYEVNEDNDCSTLTGIGTVDDEVGKVCTLEQTDYSDYAAYLNQNGQTCWSDSDVGPVPNTLINANNLS